jgi:hypothetical protein
MEAILGPCEWVKSGGKGVWCSVVGVNGYASARWFGWEGFGWVCEGSMVGVGSRVESIC